MNGDEIISVYCVTKNVWFTFSCIYALYGGRIEVIAEKEERKIKK